jgi:hypothetical protein
MEAVVDRNFCRALLMASMWFSCFAGSRVALSVYVLVAIVKKQLGLDLSLYKVLQILRVTVFEKTPILEGFSNFSNEFPDVALKALKEKQMP